MPATRTLAQLRASARQYADMTGSDFRTDAEVNHLVNLGLRSLWSVLVQSDQDRYLARTEVATTSGTREYALPADFVAVRLVELLEGTGSERAWPLERYSLSEGHTSDTTLWEAYPYEGAGIRYAVVMQGRDGSATVLRFDPDPGTRFFRVWYEQRFDDLAADGDTFDGVNGWEDWAALWAAEQLLAEEESAFQHLTMRRAELTERIKNIAGDRDMGRAPRVARTRRRRGRGPRARTG